MKIYKENRPWGSFEILLDSESTKVKRITVEPLGKLSYQYHQHRAEHWVVVEGQAQITLDDEVRQLTQGMSVYIPTGAKHRIENIGDTPLVFIEVQTGTYFGEDDIVRLEDQYNRL